MKKTWLLLDCNNLLHAAFYTTGHLTHKQVATGTVYGFLRRVLSLQDQFQTKNIVFAFDYGRPLRCKILPSYKSRRHEKYKNMTDEEKKARKEFQRQVDWLRLDILSDLGFVNVLWEKGFEADDVIASVCKHSLARSQEVVIISSDSDMLQLLRDRRKVYNPISKKMFDVYTTTPPELLPQDLYRAKALAGCISDDIPGIEGIGEATALKYLSGRLGVNTQAYQKIHAWSKKLYMRNIRLVRLPYENTPIFTLSKDHVTRAKWIDLARRLGMKSLLRGKI